MIFSSAGRKEKKRESPASALGFFLGLLQFRPQKEKGGKKGVALEATTVAYRRLRTKAKRRGSPGQRLFDSLLVFISVSEGKTGAPISSSRVQP